MSQNHFSAFPLVDWNKVFDRMCQVINRQNIYLSVNMASKNKDSIISIRKIRNVKEEEKHDYRPKINYFHIS